MDPLSILLIVFFGMVAIAIFAVVVAAIIRAFGSQKNQQQTNNQSYQHSSEQSTNDFGKQLEKDSIEDSEGDGLILFDDPMFPPEFDDEDDEF
ncbi:MAG: hypothetical protein ABSA75_13160 [Candidatus Bathyarchaeia archaeon]